MGTEEVVAKKSSQWNALCRQPPPSPFWTLRVHRKEPHCQYGLPVKLSTIHYPLSTLFCLLLLLAGCPKSDSDSKEKPADGR